MIGALTYADMEFIRFFLYNTREGGERISEG